MSVISEMQPTGARTAESASSDYTAANRKCRSSDGGAGNRRRSKPFPLPSTGRGIKGEGWCHQERSFSIRPFGLFLLLIFFCFPALAHDPYEITSTIRLETNRTLVEIEMEFNGAMLLVGVPRSQQPPDQTALFRAKLTDLQRQAGQFFELADATGPLSATSTNVTLGVENHVKFALEYPPTRTGLKLNAIALKSLSENGPFGTTVTVLDLVNKTVLGQSVLFSNSPAATFALPTSTSTNTFVVLPQTNTPPPSQAVTPPVPTPKHPPEKQSIWNFIVVGSFGVFLLILLRRWRAAGGSQ